MSDDILVRDARPEEYPLVGDLTVAAYREYEPRLSAAVWQIYEADLRGVEERAKESQTLVAERSGELAGAVAYYPPGERAAKWFPDEWGFIRVLAVPPSQRGHGVGRRLTEECIQRARAAKAAGIGLLTTDLMLIAKGMYERMGFVQQAEFDANVGEKFWAYGLQLSSG
jgi:ribosomal protein S18 acetylase RimI-like enzyme